MCTTALLLVPVAAAAEVFDSGIGSEVFWSDNVFGTSDDEVDDTSVRLLPWGQIADSEGDLGWTLRYGPSYEYFMDLSEVRGFDHDVQGSIAWRVGPRTTLALSDSFERTHTVARFNEGTEPGQDLLLQGRRDRLKANQLAGSIRHSLSPVDLISLSASWGLQDFSNDDATDSEFFSTNLFYRRQLSERTSIGSRLSASRTTTKPNTSLSDGSSLPERHTDFYNLSGVLEHSFSPTLRLSLSAGPTLIQSDNPESISPTATEADVPAFPLLRNGDDRSFIDADTCPTDRFGNRFLGVGCQAVEPPLSDPQLFILSNSTGGNIATVPIVGAFPSIDDTNTTYFADVTLVKEWQHWYGQLSYRRSEDQNSNLGAVSDIVFARLRWNLSSLLTTSLLASLERRTQATESRANVIVVQNEQTPVFAFPSGAAAQFVRPVTVDNDASVDVLGLNWQVNYQFAERAEIYSIVSYRDEGPSGDAEVLLQDVKRFSVILGVRYGFDPIPF